jgi:hypothetical protein
MAPRFKTISEPVEDPVAFSAVELAVDALAVDGASALVEAAGAGDGAEPRLRVTTTAGCGSALG